MGVTRKREKIDSEYVAAAENSINEYSKTVKYTVVDYTFEHMIERLNENRYYIPDYQREHIWKPSQKSKFIESILMGLPVPFLFFWLDENNKMEIVDGSQRLRTVKEFMDDEFRLKDLEILNKANGLKYSDFSTSVQLKIAETGTRVIILDNSTDAETRTEMFTRINTGGTTANEAEIRRGSLLGPFMDLITELSIDSDFVRMTPITKNREKEREREELITRYFAYAENFSADQRDGQGDVIGYSNSPKRFHFAFVKKMNEQVKQELSESENSETIERLKEEFIRVINFVNKVSPHGFTKTETGKQIPRVRFEAIAIGSGLALRARPELCKEVDSISEIIETEYFEHATKSDAANVKSNLVNRLRIVRDWLLEK